MSAVNAQKGGSLVIFEKWKIWKQFSLNMSIEDETDRREDKGRLFCLGDGIHTIPGQTRDLAPGLFEEKYE